MKDSSRFILACFAGIAIVLGATLYLPAIRTGQAPVVVTGEATFPDYSAGAPPGQTAANEVGIFLTLGTRNPWIQGQRQELVPSVAATPGPGVASVEITTLKIYLERPAAPNPTIVTGDLVLLVPTGANRWVSMDGPVVIYPNQDVSGDDFFLGFALSLNVWYGNGQSYGYGGWEPGVRIGSPDIVPDFTLVGLLLMAVCIGGGVLLATMWAADRRGIRIGQ